VKLKASLAVAVLFITLLTSPSEAKSFHDVTVLGESSWNKVPTLPSQLLWSKKAHSNAQEAINALALDLAATLNKFQAAGVTDVVVEKKFPERSNFWKETTNKAFKWVNIIGLNSKGDQLTSTGYSPESNVFLARTLVRLNRDECSLRDFDLWNWSTWFVNRCEIVKPTTQQLLDAHFRDLVGQGVGDRREILAWELTKLTYVLENRLEYRIVGNKLICPQLKRLSAGTDRVWLTNFDYVWDYKISIDRAHWSAKVEYLGPRPAMFAKKFEGDLMDYLDTPSTDS
jgi:hypothetical protein